MSCGSRCDRSDSAGSTFTAIGRPLPDRRVRAAQLVKALLAQRHQMLRRRSPSRARARPTALRATSVARAVGRATARERRRQLAVPRQIEHVARREPRTRIGVAAGMFAKLVHEREKHRLQRKVRPVRVERRRPDDELALADRCARRAPASHRRTARAPSRSAARVSAR